MPTNLKTMPQQLSRLIWSLVLGMLATPTLAIEVLDVRLWRAPDHTRVVFDLSDVVDHKLTQLRGRERIVLDLGGASFVASTAGLELGKTPITGVRHAARNGKDLRIVLDLSEYTKPRSFLLKANEVRGNRLVVDLYDVGKQ